MICKSTGITMVVKCLICGVCVLHTVWLWHTHTTTFFACQGWKRRREARLFQQEVEQLNHRFPVMSCHHVSAFEEFIPETFGTATSMCFVGNWHHLVCLSWVYSCDFFLQERFKLSAQHRLINLISRQGHWARAAMERINLLDDSIKTINAIHKVTQKRSTIDSRLFETDWDDVTQTTFNWSQAFEYWSEAVITDFKTKSASRWIVSELHGQSFCPFLGCIHGFWNRVPYKLGKGVFSARVTNVSIRPLIPAANKVTKTGAEGWLIEKKQVM